MPNTEDFTLLTPVLFFVQLVGVIVFDITMGSNLNLGSPEAGGSAVLWQFVPALFSIILGALGAAWKPLHSSGKWIWVPGLVLVLAIGLERGLNRFPQRLASEFSGQNPVGMIVPILTLSCAVYSLTLVVVARLLSLVNRTRIT
jgi:hypothetical protein